MVKLSSRKVNPRVAVNYRGLGKSLRRSEMHPQFTQERVARFWASVDKTGDCWLWARYRHPSGYGQFSHMQAHRVAWELTHGPIPEGVVVCHRCDNPSCVNPDHLFLGTDAENIADRDAKGRGPRGLRNGRAVLTPDRVGELRAAAQGGLSAAQLGRMFGVSPSQANRVATGKRWA